MDDCLEEYTREGALHGRPICMKQLEMNSEQIWMRDPSLQCQEELMPKKKVSISKLISDNRGDKDTSQVQHNLLE